jgi:hypothetical protein
VRIHLAGKHTLKLEPLDHRRQTRDVSLDLIGRLGVGLFGDQFEQFRGVAQAAREVVQVVDHPFELRSFFSEFLRAIRVVPDAGLLELASYFLKALVLVVVIKDTPSRSRCVPRDR